MTKEEVKEYIKSLDLGAELQELAFDLVDNAKEVDQKLLDKIANLIEAQADFHDQTADVLDTEADIYENLAENMKDLDAEENAQRAEATAQNQEELLNNIKTVVDSEDISGQPTPPPAPPTETPQP